MINRPNLTLQEEIQLARLQASAMSFICLMLCLFATTAATRIPHYLETTDYARLIGVILFGLLVAIGSASNFHTHLCLINRKKSLSLTRRTPYEIFNK